jgi:hypothetical protein
MLTLDMGKAKEEHKSMRPEIPANLQDLRDCQPCKKKMMEKMKEKQKEKTQDETPIPGINLPIWVENIIVFGARILAARYRKKLEDREE